MIKYSIPFRGRLPYDPFEVHLTKQLARVGIIDNNYETLYKSVDSVYGFIGPTPLNGGRSNFNNEIVQRDFSIALENKIKVRMPLTTTKATRDAYEHHTTKDVLHFLNDFNGGVVVYDDKLANWIREDFPNVSIEASAIKCLDTLDKIEEALKLYTTICLPVKMSKNNDDILNEVSDKSRVRLFATNECSSNCPKWTCYHMISRMSANNLLEHEGNEEKMTEERDNYFCSKSILNKDGTQKYPRADWWEDGMVFDIEHLNSIGYNRFKISNGV
jgi:hypothetical protein